MATSGTFTFSMEISDVIEEAYERIGSELRSGYDLRTARRSLDLLLLEWQNRGLNLWTVKNADQALTAGTAEYVLSAEKVDIIEGLLRTSAGDTAKQVDLTMSRVSVSHYSRQTNKLAVGRPINFWLTRAPTGAITVTLWPVPDAVTPYVFNYYYLERIEDTGTPASNNLSIPPRHLPALVAGLAYQIALKKPDKAALWPGLQQEYERQWTLAADSVREKASLFLSPGGYRSL